MLNRVFVVVLVCAVALFTAWFAERPAAPELTHVSVGIWQMNDEGGFEFVSPMGIVGDAIDAGTIADGVFGASDETAVSSTIEPDGTAHG